LSNWRATAGFGLARDVMREGAEAVMRILDGVDALRGSLDYHLARHNLLTANLAHADTPGFKPLDLQRTGAFEGALHAALETTSPGHIGGASSPSTGETWKVVQDASAQAAGNDGNAVSLDREAVKIATNQLRYDTIASLVQGQLSGLEWAVNDGRGA
jgi:flagellar basal-body rod protein FlgB